MLATAARCQAMATQASEASAIQAPPIQTPPPPAATSAPIEADLTLPNAPGYNSPSALPPQDTQATEPPPGTQSSTRNIRPPSSSRRTRPTSRYDKYIDDIEIPQPLTSRDKVILGVRASVTPYALLSIVSAASYEQIRDSSPNYGTDSTAFGQRIGAAAARGTSEEIFTASLFSPIFHQDPRYYELGQGHTVFARATYAISRVIISRRDDGGAMPNYALFAGYASAAALTNAYYPPGNRGIGQTARTFGVSVGGSAFSFLFREFIDEALYSIHLGKNSH
jgi:hypothetical protein